MKKIPLRVVKLGGSLLEHGDWPAAWDRWQRSQRCADSVVVAGGGRLVDAIRQYAAALKLRDADAHWLAIAAMSVTVRMAAVTLSADGGVCTCFEELSTRQGTGETVVFDPQAFLRSAEPHAAGCRLPSNWDATSDSIAGRLAELLGADELVLLKSRLPSAACSWVAAAAEGYVDCHFPSAVAAVRTARCVNLRDPALAEWRPPA